MRSLIYLIPMGMLFSFVSLRNIHSDLREYCATHAGLASETCFAALPEPPVVRSPRLTIPNLIVRAALAEGIDPSRALARAWEESNYLNVESACCRSVFQLHRALFPEMPVEENIRTGVQILARYYRITHNWPEAHSWYRKGHR